MRERQGGVAVKTPWRDPMLKIQEREDRPTLPPDVRWAGWWEVWGMHRAAGSARSHSAKTRCSQGDASAGAFREGIVPVAAEKDAISR